MVGSIELNILNSFLQHCIFLLKAIEQRLIHGNLACVKVGVLRTH